MYLVAIIDWNSRRVLSWRLSNTMGADFCVSALTEALALYGAPEIFNSDQVRWTPSFGQSDRYVKQWAGGWGWLSCYSGLVSLSLEVGLVGSLASQSVMGPFGIVEFDVSGQPSSE